MSRPARLGQRPAQHLGPRLFLLLDPQNFMMAQAEGKACGALLWSAAPTCVSGRFGWMTHCVGSSEARAKSKAVPTPAY
jgi:hypothetical protein